MSEETKRDPLSVIAAFEAAAFRTSHLARRLLSEHPGLPLEEMKPRTQASKLYSGGVRVLAELDIDVPDTDGVRAWAEALEADAGEQTINGVGRHVYEYLYAQAVIGGVEVKVSGVRRLSDDEAAAWRAAGDDGSGGEQ